MWAAHILTLSRVPIALALVWSYGHAAWSVALIGLAAATDVADGTVARWMQARGHVRPAIGGWLDPLVDKVFVVIVLAVIYRHGHDARLIALIAARELVLVPLIVVYLLRGRPSAHLHADPIGKAATIVQLVAVAVAVAAPRGAMPVAVAAATLGIAAVAHYIVREVRA